MTTPPRIGFVLAAAILIGSGCGGPAGKDRVTLIMKAASNPFFQAMEAGAREEAAKQGVVLNAVAPDSETDVVQQVEFIKQAITRRTGAILIAPADANGVIDALAKAQKAGIPVVNLDNAIPPRLVQGQGLKPIPFIGPDNQHAAYEVARYAAGLIKDGGAARQGVLLLQGIEGTANGDARRDGFEQAMDQAGIPIVGRATADWKEEVARDKTDALLNAHPDVRGILAANDQMALGALAAVESKGLAGKVVIVGYDDLQAVREQIQKGTIQATVEQHPATMGALGVRAALALMKGRPWPDRTPVPTEVITAESLQKDRSTIRRGRG